MPIMRVFLSVFKQLFHYYRIGAGLNCELHGRTNRTISSHQMESRFRKAQHGDLGQQYLVLMITNPVYTTNTCMHAVCI